MEWKLVKAPIIDGDEFFGKGFRTEDSKIAKRGDTYYMFVSSGRWTDSMEIYVLNSKSLLGPWVKCQEKPIIETGNFFGFDYRYLRLGSINFDDGSWHLYYSGQNFLKEDSVGIAMTSDADFPFGWKKYSRNPVLKKSGKGWESSAILTLCLKKINDRWYGHYTGKGKDRKYHLGICYGESPLGPFKRYQGNPILGQGNWDFNGPARADFVKTENKIYGTYESTKTGPVFQIGGYEGDSLDGPFKKIFNEKPWLSGLSQGLQYANPCLWYENKKLYLLATRKEVTNTTPYWRYVDLFIHEPTP